MENADEYKIISNLYIDTWLTGNIEPKHTGIDAMEWITFKQHDMPPSIFIGLNKNKLSSCDIVVSFEENPKLIAACGAMFPPALWEQVLKWIKLNRVELTRHWNQELSTCEAMELLKKI